MSIAKFFRLPKFATAPFCPSEVQGEIHIPKDASMWKKILIFIGPGLLVSVGYMDPGNWATDIEAGSKFGYSLLSIVLFSSLAAMFLQCITMKVGLVTKRDLAQLCSDRFPKKLNATLWILAEIAIIATDVAEVLGAALAFKLLLGVSLKTGILLTAMDTFIVLGLRGKGFRKVEAVILGLILTIGICFMAELIFIKPYWPDVAMGYIPRAEVLMNHDAWYLAIGILGATVMPHNLFLHSSIIQTRKIGDSVEEKKSAIRYNTFDTVGSLSLAFLVNSAILILAGAAFHHQGNFTVAGIDEAYHLLDPIVGGTIAGLLFGIALLAAGQSSTFTGTISAQIVMEGFMNWKIPCWQRRLITRGLALIPAYIGVSMWGDNSTGRLLVLSQVILSLQLPFTIFPLLMFAGNKELMGEFKLNIFTQYSAWLLLTVIVTANGILLINFF
ncbi:Nramp family divalent metal transporter [Bacteriovorax sp. PP10]|uniref:Divalent metal cation transporter MntH n=1 Tax=Bacteriovorax antarcticus TaxID=3088717 RepID=A0ABU5VYL2_9BACT|nr:Nramp family divalent metal transporter [Bacteriovorax sp. PP10]MEA9357404.1 Nramp family divalent metal transporter [Bacteriovorax sp. PP10]